MIRSSLSCAKWWSGKRRAAAAGLPPSTCCHTFRAMGIRAYLSSGGTLEHAQQIVSTNVAVRRDGLPYARQRTPEDPGDVLPRLGVRRGCEHYLRRDTLA